MFHIVDTVPCDNEEALGERLKGRIPSRCCGEAPLDSVTQGRARSHRGTQHRHGGQRYAIGHFILTI